MDDVERNEKVMTFCSIAGCDVEFATSFLDSYGWSLEAAVNNFMQEGLGGGGGAGGGGGGEGGIGAGAGAGAGADSASFDAAAAIPGMGDEFAGGGWVEPEEERAPLPQFSDTLVEADPAARAPRRAESGPPQVHPLEAFRDPQGEASAGGGSGGKGEVFGLTKKPKNLAEIYAAPTKLCFAGNFEQLREAGREQGRWLLVNIQSPTEFASQQLNADTWRDETMEAVIGASFLFWQQYYDSADGAAFCRFYLPNAPANLPHICVIDPRTGGSVKHWTGFKEVERLMDKLMEFADEPPSCDALQQMYASSEPAAALSPLRSAHVRAAGADDEPMPSADATPSAAA